MRPTNFIDLISIWNNQWKPDQTLKTLQEVKLKRLVNHAYQNVPYYRDLFVASGITPEDINTLEDLKLIPPTSKKQLQELSLKDKLATDISPKTCIQNTTSGTTGIPLKSYYTQNDSTLMSLSWARAFLSSGMKPWHRMSALVGKPTVRETQSWYEYFGLWRRKEITSWKSPEEWVGEIQKWKPKIIIGYVMTLKLLAETMQQDDIKDISPDIIFHSSAILDDYSRQYLKSVFHSKIIDIYGSDEAGCIAWECDQCAGYHISADMVIMEVIKNGEPAPPGIEGDIIITNLHSYAMPFIRYLQDDVGILSERKPACGRNFPLLDRIQGRMDDFIILNTGQKLSPHPFYHCIDPVPGVKRWKIVQERRNRISVYIEPGTGFSNSTVPIIKENLDKLLNGGLEYDVTSVDSIPTDPASKFRAVSSKIDE